MDAATGEILKPQLSKPKVLSSKKAVVSTDVPSSETLLKLERNEIVHIAPETTTDDTPLNSFTRWVARKSDKEYIYLYRKPQASDGNYSWVIEANPYYKNTRDTSVIDTSVFKPNRRATSKMVFKASVSRPSPAPREIQMSNVLTQPVASAIPATRVIPPVSATPFSSTDDIMKFNLTVRGRRTVAPSADYNKDDALMCAKASQLAYQPYPAMDGFISNREEFLNNTLSYTVFRSSTTVIISFRGTDNLDNWRSNIDTPLVKWNRVSTFRGLVHKGWKDLMNVMDDKLQLLFNGGFDINKRVLITGHSLGSAFAMMTRLRYANRIDLINNIMVYGFGSPKWTDTIGATQYNDLFDDVFNVYNLYDYSAYLPPSMTSVGREVILNKTGALAFERGWAMDMEAIRELVIAPILSGFMTWLNIYQASKFLTNALINQVVEASIVGQSMTDVERLRTVGFYNAMTGSSILNLPSGTVPRSGIAPIPQTAIDMFGTPEWRDISSRWEAFGRLYNNHYSVEISKGVIPEVARRTAYNETIWLLGGRPAFSASTNAQISAEFMEQLSGTLGGEATLALTTGTATNRIAFLTSVAGMPELTASVAVRTIQALPLIGAVAGIVVVLYSAVKLIQESHSVDTYLEWCAKQYQPVATPGSISVDDILKGFKQSIYAEAITPEGDLTPEKMREALNVLELMGKGRVDDVAGNPADAVRIDTTRPLSLIETSSVIHHGKWVGRKIFEMNIDNRKAGNRKLQEIPNATTEINTTTTNATNTTSHTPKLPKWEAYGIFGLLGSIVGAFLGAAAKHAYDRSAAHRATVAAINGGTASYAVVPQNQIELRRLTQTTNDEIDALTRRVLSTTPTIEGQSMGGNTDQVLPIPSKIDRKTQIDMLLAALGSALMVGAAYLYTPEVLAAGLIAMVSDWALSSAAVVPITEEEIAAAGEEQLWNGLTEQERQRMIDEFVERYLARERQFQAGNDSDSDRRLSASQLTTGLKRIIQITIKNKELERQITTRIPEIAKRVHSQHKTTNQSPLVPMSMPIVNAPPDRRIEPTLRQRKGMGEQQTLLP